MKLYVTKTKNSLIVVNEIWWKSIVSDLMTLIVVGSLMGLNIYFHSVSEGNWFLDVIFVFSILSWLITKFNYQKETYNKEEIKKLIDDL